MSTSPVDFVALLFQPLCLNCTITSLCWPCALSLDAYDALCVALGIALPEDAPDDLQDDG